MQTGMLVLLLCLLLSMLLRHAGVDAQGCLLLISDIDQSDDMLRHQSTRHCGSTRDSKQTRRVQVTCLRRACVFVLYSKKRRRTRSN
jgi:hypothetical protein